MDYISIGKFQKKQDLILKDTGYLAFEIGYKQAKDVSKILEDNNFAILSVVKDYGGNDRVVLAKKAIKADNFEEIEEEEDVDFILVIMIIFLPERTYRSKT